MPSGLPVAVTSLNYFACCKLERYLKRARVFTKVIHGRSRVGKGLVGIRDGKRGWFKAVHHDLDGS